MGDYVNDIRGLTEVLQQTKSGTTISFVPGIAQFDPSQTGNAQWSNFHQDAISNRALSDGGAATSKRWDYEPFGTVRTQSGAAGSDFQFAGEQKDAESGLINLRARYYEPSIGRFLSRDVMSGRTGFPQTFNRYAYTLNNPLRFVDPSGYCEQGQATGSDRDCPRDEDDDYWKDPPHSTDDDDGSKPAQPDPQDTPSGGFRGDNPSPGLGYTGSFASQIVQIGSLCFERISWPPILLPVQCPKQGADTDKAYANQEGRMRVQAQLGLSDDPRENRGVALSDGRNGKGVVGALVFMAALELSLDPWLPRRIQEEIVSSLPIFQQRLEAIIKGNGISGLRKGVVYIPLSDNWRLEVDQLSGWNLRSWAGEK